MWKTITKVVQLLGMFLAWTLRMNGSISVMLRVHILNYISLPLCTILMQHRSCFSNRCALYRVSAEGFRLQLVLGAVSRRNEHQESGNMAHPPWNFDISVYLIFVYVSRIMHADVLVMVPSVHLIITLSVCFFQCIYRENTEKNISVSYVCLKLQ